MDGSNPGHGGGGCRGEGCEMDGNGGCEVGVMWREIANFKSDGAKQFLVVASDGCRDSLRIPQEVGCHLRNMIPESKHFILQGPDGRKYPVVVSWEAGEVILRTGWHDFATANHIEEDYSIRFVYHGDSIFKVHISDSSGNKKSCSCSQAPFGIFGAVPPCDYPLLNEQVVHDPEPVKTSNDIVYTTGCPLTVAQDEKVLELATMMSEMKSEIPLHVAAMNRNVNLKGSCLYIPLQLALDHFKDKQTNATIDLKGPDKKIYSVGARKHSDDQIVLYYEWDTFVAFQHIQEKDLVIFRSIENSPLEVVILDHSGHEKPSSCVVKGNSSSTEEMSGDSLDIVDPPARPIIELSSSDDDDMVREGTPKAQKMASTSALPRKPRGRPRKAQKMASTSALPRRPRGRPPIAKKSGSEAYIMSSKGRTLTNKQKEKVCEKVQAIRSEFPIFVRVMSTRPAHPMRFCLEYASACLSGEKNQVLVLELEGRQWRTMLNVSVNNVTEICKGWKDFAGDNRLEAGDICLFELAERAKGSLTMKVHVIRGSGV